MSNNATGATIEIIERTTHPDPEVIVPNDVRINGQSLLCSADHPVTVHEIDIEDRSIVYVTLTLLAKRVTISAEQIAE